MSDSPRQRIERVPGSRRVRLTAVPGAVEEPLAPSEKQPEAANKVGPNDDRMRQDVPPHY